MNKTPLTEEQIIEWAKAWHAKYLRWPTCGDGHVELADKTWSCIDILLRKGLSGLPGGDSIAKLLVRNGLKAKYKPGTLRKGYRDDPPACDVNASSN